MRLPAVFDARKTGRRPAICGLAAVAVMAISVTAAPAQLTRGFDIVVPAAPSGPELTHQPNLWVLETHLKPLRMIQVELTDPETGKKERQPVWYLVYKVINRPLDRRDGGDRTPVNETDPEPGPPLFAPEFTLVAQDAGNRTIYQDEILPEAHAAVERRERMELKNSVQIVSPIPEETAPGSRPEKALYGVATWRGIDPEADFYSVYLSGFSSGYTHGEGPDGAETVLRKTILVEFWRPGDEFNPNEREFRLRGEPRWMYRVDEPDAASEQPSAGEPAEPPAPEPQ